MVRDTFAGVGVAMALTACVCTSAQAAVQTYLTPAAFNQAANNLTTYTIPGPPTNSLASYTLGPLTFVSQGLLFIVDDGAYGDGIPYIDALSPAPVVPGINLFVSAGGPSALSFLFADFDAARPIDIAVDGSLVATVIAGPSLFGAPQPNVGFIGLTSSSPIASVTFRNPFGFETDILGFQAGNANVVAVPEPATFALLSTGLLGLGLTRRRGHKPNPA